MHVTVKYLGYFEITVKFAFNIQKILQLKDDACLDGRVACIKLVDEDKGGPLDLILHTGRSPAYYSAQSFDQFAASFRSGDSTFESWCKKKPCK